MKYKKENPQPPLNNDDLSNIYHALGVFQDDLERSIRILEMDDIHKDHDNGIVSEIKLSINKKILSLSTLRKRVIEMRVR